ncbi:Sodium-dependent multivitamin transporter [Holothuria leucospilota]|uniref:Sodium-dependent multivitamin transporter n=1 Tax=Holothuria leucospilota TaxID=206669 RepID=A0A9Q1BX57_HOLLE|nr:Sodium-dependent multivitamin transporter [Holothuria leucospilota]
MATCILVLVTGSSQVGGVDEAWKINKNAGRLDIFTFPFDVTERMTFLSIVIGGAVNRLPMWAVSQTAVQRFLAAKSLRDAEISVWLNVPMLTLVIGVCCLEGLVMYAFYYGRSCHMSVVADTPHGNILQILIYFVNEQFGHIPGYRGLFLSCLVAASLSTISSGLNAMASVALVDILGTYRAMRDKDYLKSRKNDKRDTTISRGFTILFGAISVGLAFITMKLGTIVSMFNSVFGAAGGPLVATFLLGIFWRRANEP